MKFEEILKEYNIDIKLDQINQFEIYKKLLLEWNEKINITRITEGQEIYIKHFLDSLTLINTGLIEEGKSLIDIGTGGGFPGLPLKIMYPDLKMTLMDSLNKRIIFLQEVIKELNLKNIEAVHGRAEEYGRKEDYREKFDIVTNRALANMSSLAEYSLPFVKKAGYFIAMKGSEYKEEVKEAKNAIDILGGKIVDIKEIRLPGEILHSLIIVEKIRETPKKYPRAGGKPKTQPL